MADLLYNRIKSPTGAPVEMMTGAAGPMFDSGGAEFNLLHPKYGGGTGKTAAQNDTAFLNVLDDVVNAGGGRIVVPATPTGEALRFASPWTFDGESNIAIVGPGWEASNIECEAGFIVATNNTRQISLEGLRVRCIEEVNSHHGIDLDYPRRWDIRRMHISRFGGDSIRLGGGLHCHVEHNYISARDAPKANGHAGIAVVPSAGGTGAAVFRLAHNYIVSSAEYGLYLLTGGSSISEMDVMENCDVTALYTEAPWVFLRPYFEGNAPDAFHAHDARFTLIAPRMQTIPGSGGEREEPKVTWQGIGHGTRYYTYLHSIYQDHVLGRDVLVGRDARVEGDLGVGGDIALGASELPEHANRDRALHVFGQPTSSDDPDSEVAAVVQNNRSNRNDARASYRFLHRTTEGQSGEGGRVTSQRKGTYTSAGNSHADIEVFAVSSGVERHIATFVRDGDIEIHTNGRGVIARSPDGTRYRLAPPNGGGAATWVAV